MAIFHIRKEVGRVMHVEIKVLEEVTDTYEWLLLGTL